MKLFPRANRPLEYVAFFVIDVPTREGVAHAYLACDLFSEFAFSMGSSLDEDKGTILDQIHILMRDKDFVKHKNKGFNLVLGEFEELVEDIERIITPHKGKVIFDPQFCKHIAKPVEDNFLKWN